MTSGKLNGTRSHLAEVREIASRFSQCFSFGIARMPKRKNDDGPKVEAPEKFAKSDPPKAKAKAKAVANKKAVSAPKAKAKASVQKVVVAETELALVLDASPQRDRQHSKAVWQAAWRAIRAKLGNRAEDAKDARNGDGQSLLEVVYLHTRIWPR